MRYRYNDIISFFNVARISFRTEAIIYDSIIFETFNLDLISNDRRLPTMKKLTKPNISVSFDTRAMFFL